MDDVQLPELHRRCTLPPLPVLATPATALGVDDRRPNQTAIDSRLRGRRLDPLAGQLEGDSASSPVGMCPAHLEHHGFDIRRGLMRAVSWSVRPIIEAF